MKTGKVIVPLVTPKSIDDFFSLIGHVLAGGVKDLLLFGTTGEGNKFSIEEKKAMIRQLVPFINNRAHLFIALLNSSLDDMIELVNFCSQSGFEGAFVPLAYANDEQLFSQLLEKTSIDYYLYNTPSSPTKAIRDELFTIDRVKGMKDSSGDIAFVSDLIRKHRTETFKIYYGRESQVDKALQLAIDGILPGTGNIEPEMAIRLWESKDAASLASLHELKKQVDAACPGNYLQGVKNILIQRGIIH